MECHGAGHPRESKSAHVVTVLPVFSHGLQPPVPQLHPLGSLSDLERSFHTCPLPSTLPRARQRGGPGAQKDSSPKINLIYRAIVKTATKYIVTPAPPTQLSDRRKARPWPGRGSGRRCSGSIQGWAALRALGQEASQGHGGKEYVHLGQEGGDGALPPKLHLHVQGEVPWPAHGALQVDDACVSVEPLRAKVALLIALGNGQGDGVPREDGHRADAEDVCWHQQARLEVELVVGDVRRGVLALHEVMAGGALTLPAGCTGPGQLARGSGPSSPASSTLSCLQPLLSHLI